MYCTFLRISDVLISLFILELRRLDCVHNIKRLKDFDRSQLSYCTAYEQFLEKTGICGFSFYIGKESKSLKYWDLTGQEKIFFNHVDELFTILTPFDPNDLKVMLSVWKEYYKLHEMLKSLQAECIDDFHVQVEKWVKLFCSVFLSKIVTPYMHLFAKHASELIRKHGCLNNFSTQGLENLMT